MIEENDNYKVGNKTTFSMPLILCKSQKYYSLCRGKNILMRISNRSTQLGRPKHHIFCTLLDLNMPEFGSAKLLMELEYLSDKPH